MVNMIPMAKPGVRKMTAEERPTIHGTTTKVQRPFAAQLLHEDSNGGEQDRDKDHGAPTVPLQEGRGQDGAEELKHWTDGVPGR